MGRKYLQIISDLYPEHIKKFHNKNNAVQTAIVKKKKKKRWTVTSVDKNVDKCEPYTLRAGI